MPQDRLDGPTRRIPAVRPTASLVVSSCPDAAGDMSIAERLGRLFERALADERRRRRRRMIDHRG